MRRITPVFLFAAMLFIQARASADQPGPPAYVFNIPRLDNLKIDGDPGDWGQHGFRVDALSQVDGDPQSAEQFDQHLRFAWDERGLLVLISVRDTTPVEADDPKMMRQKDSVQLLLAASPDSPIKYNLMISPGFDDHHRELRFTIDDQRTPKPASDISPLVARTKTDAGYVIEALLPWKALGLEGRIGTECGINVYVNNAGFDLLQARAGWYPSRNTLRDPAGMYTLRLSDQPSPAVRSAAYATYQDFRWVNVAIALRPEAEGEPLEVIVRDGNKLLAGMTLDSPAGKQVTNLKIPIPALPSSYGPLTATMDGRIFPLPLPSDFNGMRKAALAETDFEFPRAVFSGSQFPVGQFGDPQKAIDIGGPYTTHTIYYDADQNRVISAQKPGRYGAITEIATAAGWNIKQYHTLYRLRSPIEGDLTPSQIMALASERGLTPEVISARRALVERMIGRQDFHGSSMGSGVAILLDWFLRPALPAAVTERNGPFAEDQKWWYDLNKKLGPTMYPYRVDLPNGYDANSSTRWPLIVLLHGSGSNGIDPDLFHRVVAAWPATTGRRFVLVFPVCPLRESWNPWEVNDLISEISAKYRIDPNRIYLTGSSMGGYGTYRTALQFPDRFAAIAPVCGVGDPADMARIKDLPVWAFHGDRDIDVPFEQDQKTIDALRQAGGRVRFTVYHNVAHDCWSQTYSNPTLFDWFLEQQRGHPSQPRASPPWDKGQ
jgi:predicted esterase